MEHSTHERDCIGFTLIELLIVITIIAILAAILFPVFNTAREKARQSTCQSNLKQLGLAFLQYENDYDETYTICSNSTHKSGWAYAIYPYVQSTGVFSCPSDTSARPLHTSQCSYFLNWVMTGYNNGLPTSPNHAMTLSQLTSPAMTVQLGECTKAYLTLNTSDASPTGIGLFGNSTLTIGAYATGYIGGPEYTGSTAIEPTASYATARHTNAANYLAFDGHVKWLNGTQVSPGYTYGIFSPSSSYAQTPSWYEDFGSTYNAAGTASMTTQSGGSHFVMTFSGL